MKTLRVLSGGAAQGLVEALRADFEAASGCRIDGTFGAVGAMRDRLLGGEPADLMILSRALIDGLARDGHVDAASARDIGVVETAVAVRTGDPTPPIDSAEQLRTALLAANAIHFPDPARATAGIHFAGVLSKLGLGDRLAARLRPAPNGAAAMRALAASKAARPIGCTQATEILSTPGIDLIGPLPAGCNLVTTYCCAIATRSAMAADAAQLAALLAGDPHRDLRRRLGFS
ncbi:molybdate ABC transporter substrate-binding protein [Reyranella sp.]|uniref:molybdate ABC transporter substrate-binding protein n=1 Tax=Reyranella sp. TaxID=1929291 RepID=UPI003783649F